jgi:DNA-binding CsgD family transcriptional regulator
MIMHETHTNSSYSQEVGGGTFVKRQSLSDSQKLTQISNYKICGEFYLQETKFIIILSENEPKNSPKSDVDSDDKMAETAIVGHFQVNGQFYAIIEARDSPKELKPKLAEILTQRELQIATLVALGDSNKQVANRLKISEWTISTHLRRIFIKLGVTSRAAMIYRCASLIQEVLLEDKNNSTDVMASQNCGMAR